MKDNSDIKILIATDGCESAKDICVVFDVLRASSVECHLHLVGAKKVFPQESVEETLKMKSENKDVIIFGEREGEKIKGFDFGNSPSEILKNSEKIKDKVCYHNTTAGTQAFNKCLHCKNVKEVLIASPNNLSATIKYLKKILGQKTICLVAAGDMGYCLEDFLVCKYVKSLLLGEKPELTMDQIIEKIKKTTGAKFFKNIPYYPSIDFEICFKLDVFDKILKLIDGEAVKFDVE